jgi:uncharacterized protein (TIRG00374 family)
MLFPSGQVPYRTSYTVLVLGFFMNNILPARAGELVRAHLGGKATGNPRTLVLATVASERLADGLTISLMFAGIIFFLGRGHLSSQDASTLTYVAYLFALVALGVVAVLLFRKTLFALADKVAESLNHRTLTFALQKLQVFIEGLSPLCYPSRALKIAFLSVLIWSIELCVFASVARAFDWPLSLSAAVLFMVAANFSSLVPAAPGSFGTIELFAKKVLLSVGVPGDALALSMVLTQHLIQYAVIGVQGVGMMATGKYRFKEVTDSAEEGAIQSDSVDNVQGEKVTNGSVAAEASR